MTLRIPVAVALMLALAACQGDQSSTDGADPSARSSAVAEPQTASATVTPAIDFSGFDPNTRPQDDFFRFVNGKWLNETEIPADKTRWGSFDILREESRAAVKHIIEDLAGSVALEAGSDEQKIRDFYRSFMDEERINAMGAEPIAQELARIEAISSKGELARYWGRAARVSISSPFFFWVNQDAKNTEEYILYFNQDGLGLPDRDYYFDEGEKAESNRTAYIHYLSRLFELAGMVGGPDAAQNAAQNAAQAVFDLETRMAEHHWTRVENRDRNKTYNKFDRDGMDQLAGRLAWDDFLPAAGLSDQTAFVVRQPSYFEGLSSLIEDEDLDTWKLYMKARALSDASPFLSDDFFLANFEFYGKHLRGQQQPEERWKRGVNIVNGTVGELVGKEYVKRHFPPAAKGRMVELVDNLKVAMSTSLDNLDWMTEETKVQAHDKLGKFTTKIGYPDKWRDYSALEIRPDDLIGNLVRASEHQYQQQISKLGGPIDRTEWFMNPQTVNAYYNPSMNEIVFPAAILQPPFFNMDADDAVNYGGIGAVIGHEIGHGFDDQGRKSDGDGILRDWWTEADAAEYEKRADRLVNQYESIYPLEDAHINGKLTLGENIGDLGGLTLAWRAFQHAKAGQECAPIDDYTCDQRFFLGFGQIWRSKMREEELRRRLKTDSHSPPQYRIMGSLPNFDPFYTAFEVGEGDQMWMDPSERVQIW